MRESYDEWSSAGCMLRTSYPLHILHLTNHLRVGGITRYVLFLGKEMIHRGHRVSVATSGGLVEGDFENQGFKVYRVLPRTKSILNPKLFFSAQRVARLVREEKVDLIHAHTHVTQAVAGCVSRMTGVPVVTTAHGYFRRNLGRRLFPLWGKMVVAISQPVARDLKLLHRVPAERIAVVQNAIDITETQARMAEKHPKDIRFLYKIPEGAHVVVSIARLSDDKGHDVFVRAAAEILKKRKDVYFLLFGAGREKDGLKALVEKLGIASHFFIITTVKDPTVGLAVADVFVHTATKREGFGLSIAEAMVLGKPVVLTDIPAINELFGQNGSCVMVKPSDSGALAAAVTGLLDDAAKRADVAATGQRYVLSFCSIERMADEMETVYRGALGS